MAGAGAFCSGLLVFRRFQYLLFQMTSSSSTKGHTVCACVAHLSSISVVAELNVCNETAGLWSEPHPLSSERAPLSSEPAPLWSEPAPLRSERLALCSEWAALSSEPAPLSSETFAEGSEKSTGWCQKPAN